MKYLILVLMLVGCGREMPYRYEIGCLAVDSEVPLDSSAILHNMELVPELFIEHGLVESEEEFCVSYQNVSVRVIDSIGWNCTPYVNHTRTCTEGNYDVFDGITLSKSTRAMAHEYLHAREAEEVVIDSAWHPHWDSNGYNVLSDEFAERFVPPVE